MYSVRVGKDIKSTHKSIEEAFDKSRAYAYHSRNCDIFQNETKIAEAICETHSRPSVDPTWIRLEWRVSWEVRLAHQRYYEKGNGTTKNKSEG